MKIYILFFRVICLLLNGMERVSSEKGNLNYKKVKKSNDNSSSSASPFDSIALDQQIKKKYYVSNEQELNDLFKQHGISLDDIEQKRVSVVLKSPSDDILPKLDLKAIDKKESKDLEKGEAALLSKKDLEETVDFYAKLTEQDISKIKNRLVELLVGIHKNPSETPKNISDPEKNGKIQKGVQALRKATLEQKNVGTHREQIAKKSPLVAQVTRDPKPKELVANTDPDIQDNLSEINTVVNKLLNDKLTESQGNTKFAAICGIIGTLGSSAITAGFTYLATKKH